MNLEMSIEALLFYKTEPIKKSALAETFGVSLDAITEALAQLTLSLQARGIRLTETDTAVQLVTAPEVSEFIEQVRKDEIRGDIGKAGAETLAIILYRGPLSRVEVDRIRGVNSTFIIRNLLIRGLIERRPHPTDTRSFVYAVTTDLLNHLGVQNREALPEFANIMNELDTFERQEQESTEQNNPLVS
jgi:segregation and condensation protein B